MTYQSCDDCEFQISKSEYLEEFQKAFIVIQSESDHACLGEKNRVFFKVVNQSKKRRFKITQAELSIDNTSSYIELSFAESPIGKIIDVNCGELNIIVNVSGPWKESDKVSLSVKGQTLV
ncbi:MAG: hypothetical protein H6850_04130 [Alphaproteobacteria bacterium]|nr:MAG: hypothetical protein H6850_04130 [Alphaproteobacteria bacterium]